MTELSPAALAAIGKIEKLLRLAGNNPNEAEAASAMAKVQELLAQDGASVGLDPQMNEQRRARLS